jgi:hypothetical protein
MNAGVQDVAGLVLYLMTTAITKKSKKTLRRFSQSGQVFICASTPAPQNAKRDHPTDEDT